MSKFHSLTVSDVRKETSDCVSIAFNIPSALEQEYKYIQGQYITFKLKLNGEELRRSYSLCSSPIADKELRVAIKKVTGGKASNYLNDNVKQGDILEIMVPMGNFYSTLEASNKKNYVLFAGGSGITPMMSIIKTVMKAEPNSAVTLFYGNLNEEATIFKNELDIMASTSGNRIKLFYVYDKPNQSTPDLYKGLLTQDKVRALIENHVGLNADNEFFVCGPGPMMENVKIVLEELKVNKERVHIEYFSAVIDATKKEPAVTGSDLVSKVTVIMYGIETTMDLKTSGQSVLDAALDAGVDVPYACKGAVCCTCRGKVIEGKVKMDANFALTDSEVKRGYVLTCQSHPLTEKVVIDYDAI